MYKLDRSHCFPLSLSQRFCQWASLLVPPLQLVFCSSSASSRWDVSSTDVGKGVSVWCAWGHWGTICFTESQAEGSIATGQSPGIY